MKFHVGDTFEFLVFGHLVRLEATEEDQKRVDSWTAFTVAEVKDSGVFVTDGHWWIPASSLATNRVRNHKRGWIPYGKTRFEFQDVDEGIDSYMVLDLPEWVEL